MGHVARRLVGGQGEVESVPQAFLPRRAGQVNSG